MSIYYGENKTKFITWRNLELPHPKKTRKSPEFSLDGHKWYFEVTCSWADAQEKWNFTLKCSNTSKYSDYVIIPHIETAEKYVRLASAIERCDVTSSTLSRYFGAHRDTVTMLFLFSEAFLSKGVNLNESRLPIVQDNVHSDKESIQTLCLKGLSEDIEKLFNDVESADATLKCADKSFSVHRKILAARSEVFSAMFKHDLSEKNTGIVDIVDLDSNILEMFLQYLYSGRIEEMSMDVALELYQAAEKYSVSTLKQLCASYILDNMSNDIVYDVLILADKAGDKEFMDGITSFAIKIEGFLTSIEWKDFAKKFPNIGLEVYFKCHD